MSNFKKFLCLLSFGCCLIVLQAQDKTPIFTNVPLLDRSVFFDDPEICQGKLSPNGQFLSFLKPYKGIQNIWIKKLDDSFDQAWPLSTEKERPIRQFFWSRDNRFILYLQDDGGNEQFQLFRLEVKLQMKTPSKPTLAKHLAGKAGASVSIIELPKSNPDVLYFGINDRDPVWFDLYELQLSTGRKTLVYKNENRVQDWIFDQKGVLKVMSRKAEDGTTELLSFSEGAWSKLYDCAPLETCNPLHFSPGDKKFYLLTNKTERVNLTYLSTLSLTTKAVEGLATDPEKKTDFDESIFSEMTGELKGFVINGEKRRYYWIDKDWEAEFQQLESKFSGKDVRITSMSEDDRIWLVNVGSDVDPGATYLLKRQTGELIFQYTLRPKIQVEWIAEMLPIQYPSSDGLMIPAYLTLPKGVEAKKLPCIVMPHPDAWSRDSWEFNPWTQFFANRGYAVLQPNFRGSSGYGKKFCNAGNLQWSKLIQDDLSWGIRHLTEKGIIDPDRVGIFGASFGGYSAIAGLAFNPKTYRCGVSLSGPANLFDYTESLSRQPNIVPAILQKRVGNSKEPEERSILEDGSPIFSTRNIKDPLLLIQGADDPIVTKKATDQFAAVCRDSGVPVEYLLASGEGHVMVNPLNKLAFAAYIEIFLAKHLGGRHQVDLSKELEKRLKTLTVDIRSLPYDRNFIGAEIISNAPSPEVELHPGTFQYDVIMILEKDTVEMEQEISIRVAEDEWIIQESIDSRLGKISDETHVEQGTLLPKSRFVRQGTVRMDFVYSDTALTAKVKSVGLENNIYKALKAPLFAEGAGTSQILGCLPLKVGYRAIFRNFDANLQMIRYKELQVTGIEQIEHGDKTVECFKLEITERGDEGSLSQVWVSRDAFRKVIKSTTKLPRAKGAILIAHLKNQ